MTKATASSVTTLAILLLSLSNDAFAQFDNIENALAAYLQVRSERIDPYQKIVVRAEPMTNIGNMMNDPSCIANANCQVFDVTMTGYGLAVRRPMSYLEVAVLTGTTLSPEEMEAWGAGYMLGQVGFNRAATGQTDPSGGLATLSDYFDKDPSERENSDLDGPMGQKPWLDPFSMLGAGGFMLEEGAKSVRGAEQTLANREAIAEASAGQQIAMLEQLEPQGVETIGGIRATRYESTAPPASMGAVEGQEVTAKSSSMWVDHERQLLIAHRFEGTLTENGESRDFFIEFQNSDFRNPSGCGDLLEPYKRTMSMGGVLNAEQQAQLEEAQAQLAEFDRQMADLPESQRQMMESMMGGQMDMMREMAESGSLTHTEEIIEVLCDPDLGTLFTASAAGATAAPLAGPSLLQQIQRDLTTLGYAPGNTDGVLDTMTQVAISQFEAEQGMTVTGEPSQAVADALAAEVGR